MKIKTPKESAKSDVDTDELAEFPSSFLSVENPILRITATEIPVTHPAEPDMFARHDGVPAHDQTALSGKRIVLVGGGGLNSWVAVSLARSGARHLTVIDPDRVDRTNLARQFFFQEDLGELKGMRLAANLERQAVGGAAITGIGLPFEEALEDFSIDADILVVGVDNNSCRLAAAKEARRRRIPAVFSMLSRDGMRCQVFYQDPSESEPCLWCALPNLDPDKIMPCASAIISSCFMASAFTMFFVHRSLMGWGTIEPFNWREADLTGMALNQTGMIKKRENCPVCSGS